MDLGRIVGILIGLGILCLIIYKLIPEPGKMWGYLIVAVIAIWLLVLPLLHINVH